MTGSHLRLSQIRRSRISIFVLVGIATLAAALHAGPAGLAIVSLDTMNSGAALITVLIGKVLVVIGYRVVRLRRRRPMSGSGDTPIQ